MSARRDPPLAPPSSGEAHLEEARTRPFAPGRQPAPPVVNTFVYAATDPLRDPPSEPPTPSSPTVLPTVTSALGPGEELASWPAIALRFALLAGLALTLLAANILLAPSPPAARPSSDGAHVTAPSLLGSSPASPPTPRPDPLTPAPAAPPRNTPPAPPHELGAPTHAAAPSASSSPLEARDPGPAPAPAFPHRRALAALAPAHPALRLCAQRGHVWGVLRAELQVASDGQITRLHLLDPADNAPLETCLYGQIKTLRLPRHPGGGVLEITLDIPAFLPVGAAP